MERSDDFFGGGNHGGLLITIGERLIQRCETLVELRVRRGVWGVLAQAGNENPTSVLCCACGESAVYLGLYADSVVGVNLKACNHYQLYNGKAAEAELKVLQNSSTSGNIFQDNDLLRHNLVVFRAGENAL